MAGSASRAPGDALDPYRQMLRDNRPAFWAVMVFSAIVNVLMLSGSVYMLQVYDRVLSSGSVPTLVALFAIVTVLYAFLGFFDFIRGRMLARVAVRMQQATGGAAFAAWVTTGTGRPGQAGGDSGGPMPLLDMLRGFVSSPAMLALFDLPFVPLFVAVLFVIHPWLGWLVVAGAGVAAVLALLNRRLNGTSIRRAMEMESADRDFADRVRRNGDAVVAMGMVRTLTAQWSARRDAAMAAGQEGGNASEILAAASKAFRMMLQSAILTLGAFLVLRGEISAGMIIASSILSGRALAPVDQLIGQWQLIGRAAAAHAGLKGFFGTLAPAAAAVPLALPRPSGRISVQRLTKLAPGAEGGDRPRILTQVGFDLAPGDGLGVIGNSSSGKSTLARLLAGAWTPDGGEIRLDGATRDQWDPAVLGRAIGYLPQAFDLLPGTIGANIARFDPAARDEDVIAAARMAGVHEMILNLPEGYGTRVGGRADETPLSGGQIQRLGLARAVFGTPAIVVLDEPNANLDVAGDEALSAAIAALRKAGSTVIVMAHRPSAIAAVNKVLVLHNGMVAQFGDKDSVLGTPARSPSAQSVTTLPGLVRPGAQGLAAADASPAGRAPGQAPAQAPGQSGGQACGQAPRTAPRLFRKDPLQAQA